MFVIGNIGEPSTGFSENQGESVDVRYFNYELDPVYTREEGELMQNFLAKHGRMPNADDEFEDFE